MDKDSEILASILKEIQAAELPDLSSRIVKIFECLGKLARNNWLLRHPQPGEAEVLYGSQPYWQKVRGFLERQVRSEQPAQSEEAIDSSLNSVSNGPVTPESLTWLAEEAVNTARTPYYQAGARQRLEQSLRRARSETARSEERVGFEAMRLIAELMVSIGSVSPGARIERDDELNGPYEVEVRQSPSFISPTVRVTRDDEKGPYELEAEELPSLTKRSQKSTSEGEIPGEFEMEQLQKASLERLRSIGGPLAAKELSSRLTSRLHPKKCQILWVLAELARQPYEAPEELTLRQRHAEDVTALLDRVVSASDSSAGCGLFEKVIHNMKEYRNEILNDDL